MLIRDDELHRIAIDRCISASGRYQSVFCCRYERGQTKYYIVNLVASTHRIRQIVRLATDHYFFANTIWEEWKHRFSRKPDDAVYENDIPAGLSRIRWSPPILIREDLFMLKLKPKGGYMFVRDITPVDEVTLRAQQANLEVVVAEENKPRPSMAIIINLGPDPLLHEEFKVGDIVMFRNHAGGTFMEAGYEYRYLLHHEVIGSRSPDDGLDDILPPKLSPEMIEWARGLRRTVEEIAAREYAKPLTTEILKDSTL